MILFSVLKSKVKNYFWNQILFAFPLHEIQVEFSSSSSFYKNSMGWLATKKKKGRIELLPFPCDYAI